MELRVSFKNIPEDDKEHLKKAAVAKLEDLNRYFGHDQQEGELTGECMIEYTGQHPAYTVHVSITHRQGKLHVFEVIEKADHAEEAITTAKNTLRAQISDARDKMLA